MALTTTTTIPSGVQELYDKLLLAYAQPRLIHGLWAQKRPLKKGHGKQIKFRRYDKLAKAKTALTEGITPAGKQLSATDLTATINPYGDYVTLTDMVILTQVDPQVKDALRILGDQKGETIDELMRDVMQAGTSVYRANDVADRSSIITKPSTDDLDNIERLLDRNNALKVTSMINASTGIGTTPLDACYVSVWHTDAKKDLRALNGFIKVEEYPNTSKTLPGEFGTYGNIRCCATTEAKIVPDAGAPVSTSGLKTTSGSNVDVYCALIFGGDSYADIPLAGMEAEVIVKSPRKDDGNTNDPLNMRHTCGWKAFWAGRILNDDWLYRYEHGVSD